MQILFGAHETIVKINSKSMNIEYIQHYISTHFNSRTIVGNSIKIPESRANLYHRIFLLKWFYALYAKKNEPLPELKKSLLQRYHKTIKIILPQKIIHTIKYKIVDAKTLHITITPQNSKIALKIKTFLQIKMNISATHLELILETQNEKIRLQEFLKTNALNNAYMILNMNPKDDIKSIKKQYKKLAKKFHPDRVTNGDQELIGKQTKKFQKLLESYEIILQSN